MSIVKSLISFDKEYEGELFHDDQIKAFIPRLEVGERVVLNAVGMDSEDEREPGEVHVIRSREELARLRIGIFEVSARYDRKKHMAYHLKPVIPYHRIDLANAILAQEHKQIINQIKGLKYLHISEKGVLEKDSKY